MPWVILRSSNEKATLLRRACSQLTSDKSDENGSAMEWDLRRGCQDDGGGARRRKKELKMEVR